MTLRTTTNRLPGTRRRFAAAGCLALALVAAGCGDDESTSSSDAADSKASMEKAAMEKDAAMEKEAMEQEAMEKDAMKQDVMVKGDAVEAPHFVSSTPAHGSSAAVGSIRNVTINFDFDLSDATTIAVTAGGADMTTGPSKIVGDNLKLMVPVNTTKPGVYDVTYSACWPDGSCHDGSFSFEAAA